MEYIEPNYIVQAVALPNDPLFSQQWALRNTGQTGGRVGADISATQAWDVTTGSDILVAMIDTGIWRNIGQRPAALFWVIRD